MPGFIIRISTLSYWSLALWLLGPPIDIPLEAADIVNPFPPMERVTPVRRWESRDDWQLWSARNDCRLRADNHGLTVTATGHDPFFTTEVSLPAGHYRVTLRAPEGTKLPAGCTLYWSTDRHRGFSEKRRTSPATHGGSPGHIVEMTFHADTPVTGLRIDPGTRPGTIVLNSISVAAVELHPLRITQVRQSATKVEFRIENGSTAPVRFRANGEVLELAGGESIWQAVSANRQACVESVQLSVELNGWPPLTRQATVITPAATQPHWRSSVGPFDLRVAHDGSAAWIYRDQQLVAVLAPLVLKNHRVLRGRSLIRERDRWTFQQDDTEWTVAAVDNELVVQIRSAENEPIEGPVVRALGRLEQGLLSGLEYLGREERSSSKLDIETDEHLRFAPDPLKLTMPLMAFVTSSVTVAMTWDDMNLQPVYATPDFFDGMPGHRMTLRGSTVKTRIRLSSQPLEEIIMWCVRRRGLPDLPPAAFNDEQTATLDLRGLEVLASPQGWSHAAGDRWPHRFYGDMASTFWRLTGKVPQGGPWQLGGAHVSNDAIFFVTNQVENWKKSWQARVRHAIRSQQNDGSYRYRGELVRGHFEDTASGYCALRACWLLDWAYFTGDAEALAAGRKTLDYMMRFRTPRGAQTWECPLHTPDLLASAHLVHAYVRGYQLTRHQPYLQAARKWAFSGLPFVYQWDRYPVMPYATIAVYGATHWKAPNWIGLPVQWVGIVYAHSLTLLSPYDDTLDWHHLALGILRSARQMQYPAGPSVGLLPDSFSLADQGRRPPDINPCSLVSLQRRIEGIPDSLVMVNDGRFRIVGPFPMTFEQGILHVDAQAGVRYQLLVNGKSTITVESKGHDVVPLE